MASDEDNDDENEARKQQQKLDEKRAYSRQVSARARQRQKDEVATWASKAEKNKSRADKFEKHNKELEEKIQTLSASNQSLQTQVQQLTSATTMTSTPGSLMFGGGPATAVAGRTMAQPDLASVIAMREGSLAGGGAAASGDVHEHTNLNNDSSRTTLPGTGLAASGRSASLGGGGGSTGSVVDQLLGRNSQHTFDEFLLPNSQNIVARDLLYQQQQLELDRLRAMRRGSGDNIVAASDISLLQRYLPSTLGQDAQGLFSTANFSSADLARFLDMTTGQYGANQEAIRRLSMAPELARAQLIQQSLLAGQQQQLVASLLSQGDRGMSAIAGTDVEARERAVFMAAVDRNNKNQQSSDEADNRKPAAK